MCGIVAAIAEREVSRILLEGLKALEYRGYDSAGMAVIEHDTIASLREVGKVHRLERALAQQPLPGRLGIAHTRWATHGKPETRNAHPQASDHLMLVHNGVIENHQQWRERLEAQGYHFQSDTDTEVAAHLLHQRMAQGESLLQAMQWLSGQLQGAFALAAISTREPDRLLACRKGAPLVIGVGIGEHFVASDPMALLPVTRQCIYLEEGDVAEIQRESVRIYQQGQPVEREVHSLELESGKASKGEYRHWMLKEIHEQPAVLAECLEGRLDAEGRVGPLMAHDERALLAQVEQLHIVACGTSYHAALVARYWMEEWLQLPVSVEIASEYLYRRVVVPANTAFLCISQSGETLDTLNALRKAKEKGYLCTLGICNVPRSTLVREVDLCLMTRAGPEIGVASTKAYTTQLAALALLMLALGQARGLEAEPLQKAGRQLLRLPGDVEAILCHADAIHTVAEALMPKTNVIFLGRGYQYPVAMEGALKLKEISYIHAEAYPAGELKHGPLALVNEDLPVVAVAPNDRLLQKLQANMKEVQARGGQIYVFADEAVQPEGRLQGLVHLPLGGDWLSPVRASVALQLLAYDVAAMLGHDVDQPRNLAKSVTVE